MKIAVLYSGFIRSWNQCRHNQEQNLYTPETDSYFYTYTKPENTPYKQFIQIPEIYYPHLPNHPYVATKNPYSSVDGSLNNWHNQFVGFCMMQKEYDIYIKSRCDIILSGKINFEHYLIDDKNIYIPYGHDHWNGVNDQLAFGSYNVMKKYFSVYVEHQWIFDSGLQFHPENYVRENLERLGVTINRLNITNDIIRQ